MQRRTLLQTIVSLFLALVALVPPLRRLIKSPMTASGRQDAPSPQNVPWKHVVPHLVPATKHPLYCEPQPGEPVEISYVCLLLRDSRSGRADVTDWDRFRAVMKEAGTVGLADVEPPPWGPALDPNEVGYENEVDIEAHPEAPKTPLPPRV